MIVLGLETSCDETAAALVAGDRRILGETILSQTAEHRPYGGVVPEIAARAHLEHLDGLIERTMREAGLASPISTASLRPAGRASSAASWWA